MLTAERLRRLLHYDQDTGIFTWLIDAFDNVKVGASGFAGVTIKSRLKKPFVAQISDGAGKKRHLGCFSGGEEAHAAYLAAVAENPLKGTVAGSLSSNGRWRIKVGHKEHLGHRLAWLWMTGEWPPIDIDHEDDYPANNRWINLRLATPSQNGANKKKQKNNSGFKGVHVINGSKKNPYVAFIEVGGVKRYLGCFPAAEKAHAAYLQAAIVAFGEFARGG